MSDTRTDEELRAVVGAGEAAGRELSMRWHKISEAIKQRIEDCWHAKKEAVFKLDELLFAASSRCVCGAGLAYPKDIGMHGAWHCSAILLGNASRESEHDSKPFVFWEIKSEDQPSAGGRTTRPKGDLK